MKATLVIITLIITVLYSTEIKRNLTSKFTGLPVGLSKVQVSLEKNELPKGMTRASDNRLTVPTGLQSLGTVK